MKKTAVAQIRDLYNVNGLKERVVDAVIHAHFRERNGDATLGDIGDGRSPRLGVSQYTTLFALAALGLAKKSELDFLGRYLEENLYP